MGRTQCKITNCKLSGKLMNLHRTWPRESEIHLCGECQEPCNLEIHSLYTTSKYPRYFQSAASCCILSTQKVGDFHSKQKNI